MKKPPVEGGREHGEGRAQAVTRMRWTGLAVVIADESATVFSGLATPKKPARRD
jgi:hypothetical protein